MRWLLAIVALAYVSGNAPWCAADDYGNLECFYYTYQDCTMTNSLCVVNPKRSDYP